ncbi:MAG: undecaprenyl-diphosphate phosphatase [Nitrospiraceae bacterium]|nr:undecaprenyl-diphosphate phosphatase [Nitrospiraceae bacterium]
MELILLLKGMILGLVEGITEFIPVSSTGHLILAGDLMGLDDERTKVFEIFIQLGAILSILWIYREKLVHVAAGIMKRREDRGFILNLAVAFLPAAVLGLLTHHAIKAYLFNPVTVAAALVAGGIAILLIERMEHRKHVRSTDDLTLRQALGVGLAQCLALFPGVSRSGATIMGGLVIGLDRKVAAEFSFFLAIPTMFAATAYDVVKSRAALSASDLPFFAIGFVTAFVSALIVVKAFLKYVSGHNFSAFAYYRIIFGLMVLAFYWQQGWKF